MKRVFSGIAVLAFVVLLVGSIHFGVKAEDNSQTNLRYVAGCPKSSDGPNGDVRYGQEGQCRDCYLIVATENNLFVYPNQGMGWYATEKATGEIWYRGEMI